MFNQGPMYPGFGGLYSAVPKAGINWGSLLTNAQKTLGFINQAIPVFYQVKPIWSNAKTMFRVMGEMGKINSSRSNTSTQSANTTATTTNVNNQTNQDSQVTQDNQSQFQNSQPRFFI